MGQKLLFGLSLPVGREIREPVEREAVKQNPRLQTVCRYRKEGIYQYARQQEDVLIVLDENLQAASPYTGEELRRLTDLGNSRIVFLLDRSHYGDEFMHVLYCCGIYDALFFDEARAETVTALLESGRGCARAREYYGIRTRRDAEIQGDIVNEEQLNRYLEYVEGGAGEMDERYRFAATRLGGEENRILAESIAGTAAQKLRENEIYRFYRDGTKEKRRGRFKRRDAGQGTGRMPGADRICRTGDGDQMRADTGTREPVPRGWSTGDCRDGDDMLALLERFRAAGKPPAEEGSSQGEDPLDLRILMGDFLRTVDE